MRGASQTAARNRGAQPSQSISRLAIRDPIGWWKNMKPASTPDDSSTLSSTGEGSVGEVPREPIKHGALGHLSEDEELQQAVCAALIEDPELDSKHIGVRAVEGMIVLTGRVRSREDWLRAQRIAREHAGVTQVHTEQLRIDAR